MKYKIKAQKRKKDYQKYLATSWIKGGPVFKGLTVADVLRGKFN